MSSKQTYNNYDRIDELVYLIKKFNIDFSCIYFNEPDSTGHSVSPNINELKVTVRLIYNNNNYLIKVWTLQQRIFKYGNFFQNILGYSLSLLTFLTKTY